MKPSNDAAAATDRLLDVLASGTSRPMRLEDRLAELFRELRDPLYRYLLMLIWEPAASEELAQEAFLRLHREIVSGSKIKNMKSWLFRVAHNLAIDHTRTARPTDSLTDESVKAQAEAMRDTSVSDPEQTALARERFEQLTEAMSKLSARQRECLHLRAEGFRYREIASILGIGEPTVIENIRRAMQRLSKELHVSR
jgi:RNA polymerase sigma-70 factor (ECF subfamily)